MSPEPRQATSPACQATRTGSAAPAAVATIFAGSITRNTKANSETVFTPNGSAVTSLRPVRSARRFACQA